MSEAESGPPRRQPHLPRPVVSGPNQRVSDAERQAVVEQLRLNTAEGRLDMDEFEERVGQALAARTGAELQAVLVDLPHRVPVHAAAARRRHALRAILAPYVVINLFMVLIWAASGAGYFWPIWTMIGLGFPLAGALVRWARGDADGDEG